MVREKGDTIEDGADDPMLEGEEKLQLAKKEEVKFISGGDRKNGDAKIDIGEVDKKLVGTVFNCTCSMYKIPNLDDEIFKNALENERYRSAFIWYDGTVAPSNWLSKAGASAWQEVEPKNFVLSQFGENRYDLQLSDPLAKEKLKDALTEMINLGVKGFRFANAKHFIVSKDFKNEQLATTEGAPGHTDYAFWTHTHTTYQSGLGDLLNEFSQFVKNGTNGEGFVLVTENIVRPDAFFLENSTTLGIELPIYGLIPHTLAVNAPNASKLLHTELTQVVNQLGNNKWPQWNYDQLALDSSTTGLSEYHSFIMLLPGVPIASLESFKSQNLTSYVNKLEEMRTSPSYQHGKFQVYTNANDSVIAYLRLKSGNPGFFVAYNPTDVPVTANYSSISGMPEQLTVHLLSKNYDMDNVVEKTKVQAAAIPTSPKSVIILTYVPKSSE